MKTISEAGIVLESVNEKYKDFILAKEHPCIMAKSLFKMENYTLRAYEDITDSNCLGDLKNDLQAYIEQYDFTANSFKSFIAVFPNNHFDDEITFEKALWNSLQKLHELDDSSWDQSVSDDPENPQFSFSIGGKAFYIVGLHPLSSRIARQAPYTTVVFNLHYQFEKLREMGTYQMVRDTIRKNDQALQGSINPVLRDHGTDTETKQYSGRNVDEHWKCPFHPTKN